MTTENPRAFTVEGYAGDSTEGKPAFAAYSPTIDTARDDVRAYQQTRPDVRIWHITDNADGATETHFVRDPVVTGGRRKTRAPTWTSLLPAYFAVMEHGTAEGRRIAREELARMAKAADLWNASNPADDAEPDADA